jgi:hypothetical protein
MTVHRLIAPYSEEGKGQALTLIKRTKQRRDHAFTPIWRRPQFNQCHALATAGNAATAAPFPYAARAVFPSASIRRASTQRKWVSAASAPMARIGVEHSPLRLKILDLRGNRSARANLR